MNFGNSSLRMHLLRGLLGLLCLGVALVYGREIGLPAVLLLLAALWAMKGCPTCWLMGLGQTLSSRRKNDSAS